jgi:hypothetical protein
MKTFILLITLALCAGSSAFADEFRYEKEVSLSAAASAFHIQQPASPSKTAKFTGMSFYCSVACTVTLERNCTSAASTTDDSSAIAATSPDKTSSVSTMKAYHTSNASTCTTVKTYSIAAGEEKVLEVFGMRLNRTANANVGFRVTSMTGTARAYFQFDED